MTEPAAIQAQKGQTRNERSCKNLLDEYVVLQQRSQDHKSTDAKRCRFVFEDLLSGYATAVEAWHKNQRATRTLSLPSYRNILEEFVVHHQRCQKQDSRDAQYRRIALEGFFADYATALKVWRKNQTDTADDFNLLEVMLLTGKEIRHSMVLAWLLDWDITGLGTHAQGDLGFRLFLEELGLSAEPCFHAALPPYQVKREVADDESRLDIQVSSSGRFLIGVEVKIWANEGLDQTVREWRGMLKRADELRVPKQAVYAFFLTPDGCDPEDHHFIPVRWRQLAKVFRGFAYKAKPLEVKLFANHYARGLERFVIPDANEKEDGHGRQTVE